MKKKEETFSLKSGNVNNSGIKYRNNFSVVFFIITNLAAKINGSDLRYCYNQLYFSAKLNFFTAKKPLTKAFMKKF